MLTISYNKTNSHPLLLLINKIKMLNNLTSRWLCYNKLFCFTAMISRGLSKISYVVTDMELWIPFIAIAVTSYIFCLTAYIFNF